MKPARLMMLLGVAIVALGWSVWVYLQPEPAVQPGASVRMVEDGSRWRSKADASAAGVMSPAREPASGAEQVRAVTTAVRAGMVGGTLAAALEESNRFERRQALERLGYETSTDGAGEALAILAEIAAGPDRAAFLRGVFTKLSEGEPLEAIQLLKDFELEADREAALSALVGEWRVELTPEQSRTTAGLRVDSKEARLIAELAGNPALCVLAANALLNGRDRAELIGLAAYLEAARDPQRALSFGDGLTGEEKKMFLTTVAQGWGRHDGEAALVWALAEQDPDLRAMKQASAMTAWAVKDPEAAARRLEDVPDPEERLKVLKLIAVQWATMDTQAALNWANGLPEPPARQQAIASIQESAPVGIGVSLATNAEGFPVVQGLVPGGPASVGGLLQPGYQIAAIGDGRGGFTDARGMSLPEVVKLIRGKPGTSALLQVVKPDGGVSSRLTIAVPRQQLLFKGSPPPEGR